MKSCATLACQVVPGLAVQLPCSAAGNLSNSAPLSCHIRDSRAVQHMTAPASAPIPIPGSCVAAFKLQKPAFPALPRMLPVIPLHQLAGRRCSCCLITLSSSHCQIPR